MKLYAAMNDEVFFLSQQWYGASVVLDDNSWLEVVENAVNKRVLCHPRFIESIGLEDANKSRFVVQVMKVDGDGMQIIVRLLVDDEMTDFFYAFGLPEEDPAVVSYADITTRLMRAFCFLDRACTDAKTLKRRGYPNTENGDVLEEIFAEVLSQKDVKIFF